MCTRDTPGTLNCFLAWYWRFFYANIMAFTSGIIVYASLLLLIYYTIVHSMLHHDSAVFDLRSSDNALPLLVCLPQSIEAECYPMPKVIWWIILLRCQFLNLWDKRLLLMLCRKILPIVAVFDGSRSMFVSSYVYKFTTSSTRYCFLALVWRLL